MAATPFDLLVARARKDTSLQEALGDRPDMPGAAAERMVPFLSRELIQRIRENGRNEALVTAIETRSAREVEIQLLEFSGAASKTQQFIDSAVEGKVPVDVAVSSFAEKDRAFELAQLLARKVDWPDNVVVPLGFPRGRETASRPLPRLRRYGKVLWQGRAHALEAHAPVFGDRERVPAPVRGTRCRRSAQRLHRHGEEAEASRQSLII